jgi:hypothetical protein
VSGQQQDRQQADQLGASDVPLGFSGRERGDEIVSRLGSSLVGQLAVVGGDLSARLVDLPGIDDDEGVEDSSKVASVGPATGLRARR